MNRLVKKLLLSFISVQQMLEKVFGLSEFSFGNKRNKVLVLLSLMLKVTFIVVYPVSYVKVLTFSQRVDSGVTMFARNMTFGFNWLFLIFIFTSETLTNKNRRKSFQDLEKLFQMLINHQSSKENFHLLVRCMLKSSVIFAGLFYMSYRKYTIRTNQNLSKSEHALEPFVYLPFVVLSLASGRIYIANIVVKHCLMTSSKAMNSQQFETSVSIKLFAYNYQRLQSFFIKFNNSNQLNLLLILLFCILNIVYEVHKIFTVHELLNELPKN